MEISDYYYKFILKSICNAKDIITGIVINTGSGG